jgi:uncharacterized protein YggU (UPF0235/DUF167 family)
MPRPRPAKPVDPSGAFLSAITSHPQGAVLSVVATPRSGVTAFGAVEGDAVRLRIAAPPVQGAANAALLRFLAEAAGVSRSTIRVVAGDTGRRKRVLFEGLTAEELERRLSRRQ